MPPACCGRTAPFDYRTAIFAYNHADWYVEVVLAKAAEDRGAFAPGASGGAQAILAWAVAHVGRFTYKLGSPTDRGGSVLDMQTREPFPAMCDCSMFVRWSMAQAGVDVGLTTVDQWTANGLLPDTETPGSSPLVSRGVGPDPPPGATDLETSSSSATVRERTATTPSGPATA